MEALILISRDALKATDHARGAGAIRAFIRRELDGVEGVGAVLWPTMNWSVVTIKLLRREPNFGITANK